MFVLGGLPELTAVAPWSDRQGLLLRLNRGARRATVRTEISPGFGSNDVPASFADPNGVVRLRFGEATEGFLRLINAAIRRGIVGIADRYRWEQLPLGNDAHLVSPPAPVGSNPQEAALHAGDNGLPAWIVTLATLYTANLGGRVERVQEGAAMWLRDGAERLEIPILYLSLQAPNVLSGEWRRMESELYPLLWHSFLIEKPPFAAKHVEEILVEKEQFRYALPLPVPAVPESIVTRQVDSRAGPKPAARRFTLRDRQRYLAMLDTRNQTDNGLFDYQRNLQAVLALQRLARRYKSVGDRQSLREVARLLVAASGHDVHDVRDQANVALERIFAPKPFDAPPATCFATVTVGANHHFHFALASLPQRYLVRVFRCRPADGLALETEVEYSDVELTLDRDSALYVGDYTFDELGQFDYVVYWRNGDTLQLLKRTECSGRINVIPDVSGEIVLEIFPDIHGHTRTYWTDGSGHPGLVYNENGEIIRLGRFSDVTAHLLELRQRYHVTALYLLGVQRRGNNREDWAPEATSPSPFAPMSLTELEPSLGGETEFRKLVRKAHELGIKVIVDVVPHLNRRSASVPADWRVQCYDDGGNLVVRASTDGKFGSWNDGALLNFRKFEVWEWLRDSVVTLIKDFGIDGIRFDSAHSVPIMMKRNNYPFTYGSMRTKEELVEGSVIVNDREDGHFITTGYYDSACRETMANPFQTFLVGAIAPTLHDEGKSFFVYLAECYWGRERYLTRSGIIPYNSALFKICENIARGKTDVREIYHLYDDYYPHALPPGTELLGILGNHDEERALSIFGHRGVRAVVGLTGFMNNMIMDYEGSAEGEGWKVYLDNIYVNWNRFEYASHRSVEGFYRTMYEFHRRNRGKGYLVWTDNNMVAAALKFSDAGITLGIFNFSNENQSVSIQFDNPVLPIADNGCYRIADPLYSPTTNHYSYFSGSELRVFKLHTTVSYADRIKLLRLEEVVDSTDVHSELLRESFFRLCAISNKSHFPFNFAFREIGSRVHTAQEFVRFLANTVIPLFGEENAHFLSLGMKRALFYVHRTGQQTADYLFRLVSLMLEHADPRMRDLGERLCSHYERGPIVFLSAEAEPFSKLGGLANVVHELPRELVRLGEEVYVISPLYRHGSEQSVRKMERALKKHQVSYTGVNVRFKIQDSEYVVGVHYGEVDGVKCFLLDHHEFFDGLYWGYTAAEKLRRRVALARARAEVIMRFDLRPICTLTNDAYTGLFNGIVRLDPYYSGSLAFRRNSFIHLIHNGGWQYFDAYNRFENGHDHFDLFNLPKWKAGDFEDPSYPDKLNCMAAGIRCSDKVITVSPAYARQLAVASDGLERLLTDVVGINNAIGPDFRRRMIRRFNASRFVDTYYPPLLELIRKEPALRAKIENRYPEILFGPRECEKVQNGRRRAILTRMRNKLLLQIERGLAVDPDTIVFAMIHRIVEQKGFQLLLEASEGVFGGLGFQGVIAGPVSHDDTRSVEIARGLSIVADYYPERASVRFGFHDVSIPLLSADVFLMPSQYEPGGIAQLEASACGCIVVARNTGGLSSTVMPIHRVRRKVYGNGFLFLDYSPAAFYDAMERCATFFRESDDATIYSARKSAQMSVRYWDVSAARYIDEIYAVKEIIRPDMPLHRHAKQGQRGPACTTIR